ncbi:MAG TPA: DUF3551 domain-containing protein [Pseudolabrys sp.]
MMRLLLTAAVFIAVMSFDLRPAPAYEAPWCAVVSIGSGAVHEDCHYNSIEECRPNVIAGNRGFCNQNPRWEGWYAPAARPRPHGKRHVRRH